MSGPLVSYVEPEDAVEDVRDIYEAIEANYGQVLNLPKVLGNSPDFLEAVMGVLVALEGSKLEDEYRELAYLKTSQVNGCEY